MSLINVTAGTVPGRMTTYAAQDGQQLAEFLSENNFDTQGYQVQVDGLPAEPTATIHQGSQIVLMRATKAAC